MQPDHTMERNSNHTLERRHCLDNKAHRRPIAHCCSQGLALLLTLLVALSSRSSPQYMHVSDRGKLSDHTSVARRRQPRNFYGGHDARIRDRTEREDQTVLLTTITRSRTEITVCSEVGDRIEKLRSALTGSSAPGAGECCDLLQTKPPPKRRGVVAGLIGGWAC
jgi:TFIIF-interacting CTD phosphatase-like protein